MATLKIFVSFEFDKDYELKNNFLQQAKEHTQHRIKNSSLNEAYPTDEWKQRAEGAVRGCDVVVVLIGQDTHNAPGVRVEVDIARRLGKPIIQVRPQKRPYTGLSGLGQPILWRWKRINRQLDSIQSERAGSSLRQTRRVGVSPLLFTSGRCLSAQPPLAVSMPHLLAGGYPSRKHDGKHCA